MASALFDGLLVLVRGGGDLATGVVYRVRKAGFPVVVTELAQPLAIRRTVALASAIYDGRFAVEDMLARRVDDVAQIPAALAVGDIPVLADEAGACIAHLEPPVVIDARIAKRNLGTTRADAPLVIGLGPGFEAGADCHAVIETNRGHRLGRVIWQGAAEPDTGTPGRIQGRAGERVLRAPADGTVQPLIDIGSVVEAGQTVATVAGEPVVAPFDGVLRGLIHPSVHVRQGLKIGDVDPRAQPAFCAQISEKALAIGGGVVEAILSAPQLQTRLWRAIG